MQCMDELEAITYYRATLFMTANAGVRAIK